MNTPAVINGQILTAEVHIGQTDTGGWAAELKTTKPVQERCRVHLPRTRRGEDKWNEIVRARSAVACKEAVDAWLLRNLPNSVTLIKTF